MQTDLRCTFSILQTLQIKNLMQDLASKHVIPYMEEKVRVLNQQVLWCLLIFIVILEKDLSSILASKGLLISAFEWIRENCF